MPFTLRNIKDDLEDIGAVFDGPPGLEFRAATKPLELEQSGLSYQRIPPGARFPYGHTHKTQEDEAGPSTGSAVGGLNPRRRRSREGTSHDARLP